MCIVGNCCLVLKVGGGVIPYGGKILYFLYICSLITAPKNKVVSYGHIGYIIVVRNASFLEII